MAIGPTVILTVAVIQIIRMKSVISNYTVYSTQYYTTFTEVMVNTVMIEHVGRTPKLKIYFYDISRGWSTNYWVIIAKFM